MLPEAADVAVTPAHARRLLRKLLTKIADLEEHDVSSPLLHNCVSQPPCQGDSDRKRLVQRSASHRNDNGRACTSSIPPAHPFKHLMLKPPQRQPRYTYKRRKCYSSDNTSDFSDADSRAPVLSQSSNVSSLSDGEASLAGYNPARWLTTPRKRHRRRISVSTAAVGTLGTSATAMETRSQSFSSRLETLIVHAKPASTNRFKAMYLLSHMVGLGEALWLGGAANSSATSARVLPLKVTAAFRLGESIARSDSCYDLDYVDQIYDAIPPFLVRFVLWQHAVSLCYLRIPAYAETLSEALWQVGAFAQQQWLIDSRLTDLDLHGDLLRPAFIAPLHLRAVDIGLAPRFISNMLQRLATADTMHPTHNALWRQFVPEGIPMPTSDAYIGGNREYNSSDNTRLIEQCVSNRTVKECSSLSRYSKWVARISNSAQCVRVLSAALEQTLLFVIRHNSKPAYNLTAVSPIEICKGGGFAWHAAVAEAIRSICSIIYTKLGDTERMSASDHREIIDSLQRCLLLFADLTDISMQNSSGNAGAAAGLTIQQELTDLCVQCQAQISLLVLRQYRSQGSIQSSTSIGDPQLVEMAQRLLDRLCNVQRLRSKENIREACTNRRKALVARFDRMVEKAQGKQSDSASPFTSRVLEGIFLPLATAGASPALLSDIALVVAEDLARCKVARAILRLALARFDTIWDRHLECSAWQQGWSQLQTACHTPAVPESKPEDGMQANIARRKLEQQLTELDQLRTSRTNTKRLKSATIVEDELGLLLSRARMKKNA
ncbi:hypothetical protein COEREDRAFT_89174 [Coemansia reversa NRRL 1564]|uniref:Uncharacterized protein n=1 Tax=Coemansia reversa (strain ATCC 12441 / NRRL 1564) TaxID=763665 RepID=A0A2G5B4P3_COERN|nr:hypothetical protein COEREDRAFT_89174 [Coemansia reversa NRRL 1564]|eukprot:PIA13961.1 hypothetical protein COEREDRAFT_89174 [Coemansia reversa NRRL 1564]